MGKMKRVSFVADRDGKILQRTYEGDINELIDLGLGENVLDFAKLLSSKGEKTILIEQNEEPCISASALEGVIEIDKIEEKKIYTSSDGYDVYWEKEVQLIHPVGIESGYDWILTAKCRMDSK